MTYAVAHQGLTAIPITVETDLLRGLPGVHIVGMGNKAIAEAAKRIRSALQQSDLPLPARKFTVNLAPAEFPKSGSQYDLAIAISLLVATGQLRQKEVDECLFIGELSLSGSVRALKDTLFARDVAQVQQLKYIFVPIDSPLSALPGDPFVIYQTPTVKALFLHLKGITQLQPLQPAPESDKPRFSLTFDDIIGQEAAKRALTIAATGHHHILLVGPPGIGKTLLAEATRSLMPNLSQQQQLQQQKLAALRGEANVQASLPPFRNPHHTVSISKLLGSPRSGPGELSLASYGILFLDEFGEYRREVLEALRQPLERRTISFTANHTITTLPATGLVIAAMNPCPCGYFGSEDSTCRCTDWQRRQYRQRLSGPLLDRFDIVLTLPFVDLKDIDKMMQKSHHVYLLKKIRAALTLQEIRYTSSDVYNGMVDSKTALGFPIDRPAAELLAQASQNLRLSSRGHFKVLKIARTIADLDQSTTITATHVAEAIQLRGELPA